MANARTIKRREQRKRKKAHQRARGERPLIDPETAFDIIDDDLPDGAYWALMEEMTGMEACDLVNDD